MTNTVEGFYAYFDEGEYRTILPSENVLNYCDKYDYYDDCFYGNDMDEWEDFEDFGGELITDLPNLNHDTVVKALLTLSTVKGTVEEQLEIVIANGDISLIKSANAIGYIPNSQN